MKNGLGYDGERDCDTVRVWKRRSVPCICTLRLEVRSALLRLLITHRRDLPERTRDWNTSWNECAIVLLCVFE